MSTPEQNRTFSRSKWVAVGVVSALATVAACALLWSQLRPTPVGIFGVATPVSSAAKWINVVAWTEPDECKTNSLEVKADEHRRYVLLDPKIDSRSPESGICPLAGGGGYLVKTVELTQPIGNRAVYQGSHDPENRVPTIQKLSNPKTQITFLR